MEKLTFAWMTSIWSFCLVISWFIVMAIFFIFPKPFPICPRFSSICFSRSLPVILEPTFLKTFLGKYFFPHVWTYDPPGCACADSLGGPPEPPPDFSPPFLSQTLSSWPVWALLELNNKKWRQNTVLHLFNPSINTYSTGMWIVQTTFPCWSGFYLPSSCQHWWRPGCPRPCSASRLDRLVPSAYYFPSLQSM